MTDSVDTRVRVWLMSMPGLFTGFDHRGVLERALEASDIHCTLDDFKAALDRVGYRPDERGRDGSYYSVLTLPER